MIKFNYLINWIFATNSNVLFHIYCNFKSQPLKFQTWTIWSSLSGLWNWFAEILGLKKSKFVAKKNSFNINLLNYLIYKQSLYNTVQYFQYSIYQYWFILLIMKQVQINCFYRNLKFQKEWITESQKIWKIVIKKFAVFSSGMIFTEK